MKSKMKIILSLLLCALLFTAALSACGDEKSASDNDAGENNEINNNGDSKPEPESTPVPETKPEPETTAEPEIPDITFDANGRFAVNCGSEEAVEGLHADQEYFRTSWGYTDGLETGVSDEIANDFGFPTGLQSVRYGTWFNYTFKVPNGDYLITLYYAENWSANRYDRIFDVTVNGSLAIEAFASWPDGIEKNTGHFVEIPVTVSDGFIKIDFDYNEDTQDTNSMVNVLVIDKK
ncbi:MAG: malectin [Oscillospiraceae bacterium]|nr:malectin [Oscillospiraceae bacterium]